MDIKELHGLFLSCGSVTTDSRSIKGGEMFFALKGDNFDGNEYALKALESGASYAVVDSSSEAASHSDQFKDEGGRSRIIPVDDTLANLQALATYHRDNTIVKGKRLTVIGLTGTNGKTTTKELIRRVLSVKYIVTATEGNLNNSIGVPLSLLKITAKTQIAVIEMGASHPDDIKELTAVSHPDFGLITNVGRAHLLGFGSYEGVKKAKGQLYDYIREHFGTVFVNVDDPVLMDMLSSRMGLSKIYYGLKLSGTEILPSSSAHPYLRLKIPSGETQIELDTNLVGTYNADNVIAAIVIGEYFGVSPEDAVKAIAAFVPSNNRSQLQKTDCNDLIIDAYNANPSSMAAALDNFSNVEAKTKVLMLGDMRELGGDSVGEHRKVVEKVFSIRPDLVFFVGDEFRKALSETSSPDNVKWFATSDDLANWLRTNPLRDSTVLIKGSRGIEMEKVLKLL